MHAGVHAGVHGCRCMRAWVRGCMRVRGCVCACRCERAGARVCTYEDPPPLKFLGSFFRRVRIVGFSWLFQEFEFVDR